MHQRSLVAYCVPDATATAIAAIAAIFTQGQDAGSQIAGGTGNVHLQHAARLLGVETGKLVASLTVAQMGGGGGGASNFMVRAYVNTLKYLKHYFSLLLLREV